MTTSEEPMDVERTLRFERLKQIADRMREVGRAHEHVSGNRVDSWADQLHAIVREALREPGAQITIEARWEDSVWKVDIDKANRNSGFACKDTLVDALNQAVEIAVENYTFRRERAGEKLDGAVGAFQPLSAEQMDKMKALVPPEGLNMGEPGAEAAPPVVCKVCSAILEIVDGEHICGLTASEAYSLGWRRGNNVAAAGESTYRAAAYKWQEKWLEARKEIRELRAGESTELTVKQVQDIHRIIERWSTDVVDYEGAADDINAYLFGGIEQPESKRAASPERSK
jgi:hypothetical protein